MAVDRPGHERRFRRELTLAAGVRQPAVPFVATASAVGGKTVRLWGGQGRRNQARELLAPVYGCGTGLSAEAALSAVGPTGHVTAADVSPAMAEKARERLGEALQCFRFGRGRTGSLVLRRNFRRGGLQSRADVLPRAGTGPLGVSSGASFGRAGCSVGEYGPRTLL